MQINDLLSLSIEKPAAGGRMIARVDGQVVLVAGAIPGERVQARVERVGKGVAYAQTVSIEEPSPDRRSGGTDPSCGGSHYIHIEYPRQLELKSLVIEDAFRRIARLPLPGRVDVAASPEDGYRMRARLHARDGRIGFYREGTHELCDHRKTRQLLPETVAVLDRVAAALEALKRDIVREVVLAENIDASERVVAIDTAAPLDLATIAPLAEVAGLTGLVVSGAVVRGTAFVVDQMESGGVPVSLQRHVLAFFQGNRFLFRNLVQHVTAQVAEASEVLDLYAGGGAFAIGAAVRSGGRVTAVEGDARAASDLLANCAAAGTVTPEREAVEVFVQKTRLRPDAVVVDPPRTGLSRDASNRIAGLRAPRIVYVSCDVATLARDARILADAGYGIERADGFDLFPNTPHVETVVVFLRK